MYRRKCSGKCNCAVFFATFRALSRFDEEQPE